VTTTRSLHLAGPVDLASAVPQLLGFTPTESLVLAGLSGTTVTAITRVDLGAIALPGVLAGLFRAIRRAASSEVIAIVYTDTAARTELLAGPIAECAAWTGMHLIAALRSTSNGIQPLSTPTRRLEGRPT
jgi:hypothetical protein